MASITWPSTLPQSIQRGSYQETLPNVSVRTQMDVGPPKMRRRFTAGYTPIQAEILISKTQAATLETFYNDTSVGGTLAFDWINHRTGSSAEYRFVKPPVYIPMGYERYRARLVLEILP